MPERGYGQKKTSGLYVDYVVDSFIEALTAWRLERHL